MVACTYDSQSRSRITVVCAYINYHCIMLLTLYVLTHIYREEKVLEKKCVFHFQSIIPVVISQIVLVVLLFGVLLHFIRIMSRKHDQYYHLILINLINLIFSLYSVNLYGIALMLSSDLTGLLNRSMA